MNINFGATFKLDPSLAKVRGEKTAKEIETAANKYLDLVKDVDAELTFTAHKPRDFDINDTVTVEGYSKDSTVRYREDQRVATNPFTWILSGLGLIVSVPVEATQSFKARKLDFSGSKFIFGQGFNPKKYFTESAETFVQRAFTTFAANAKEAKATAAAKAAAPAPEVKAEVPAEVKPQDTTPKKEGE